MAASLEQSSYRALNTRQDVERLTAWTVVMCAGVAALVALGAAVVAAVGLGEGPLRTLTGVATLAVSVALVLHGTGAGARARRRHHHAGDRIQVIALVGGLVLGIAGGVAGAVLAICALAGVWPYGLLPVAAIVTGSAAVLVAPSQYTLAWLAHRPITRGHAIAYRATTAAAWALVLGGTVAYVLGALALMGLADELTLACVAMLAVGVAVTVAAGALSARFALQIEDYRDRSIDAIADRLLDLLGARLVAARSGLRLHEAALAKLRGAADPLFDLVVPQLETAAAKEHENIEYLASQIDGLGGHTELVTVSADVEERATRGIREVVTSDDVTEPLHVLLALHAADMADEAGWNLLQEVVDEIGHHELKKEVTIRHGDKQEQVLFLERVLERLARHTFVAEPVFAPAAAYN